jgi:protein-S-isoprenylcysteine O-methyltransferase Ste14
VATAAGIRLWMAKAAAVDACTGGLLLGLAGTPRWLGGWLFVALVVASQALQLAVIGRRHPELLAERSGVGKGAERSDIALATAMAYLPILGTVAAALERRHGRSPAIHPAMRLAGLGMTISGAALGLVAMDANPFFAPVARIQAERGHVVVDRGPYAVVRHPGYAGSIVASVALPLTLGSRAAVAFGIGGVVVTLVRTAREDRFLAARLPGYGEYARRVRWRLLPGTW